MNEPLIRTKIHQYIDHFEDAQFVMGILHLADTRGIMNVLRDMVGSNIFSDVFPANSFLLAVGINCFMPQAVTAEFRSEISASGLPATMKQALRSGDYRIRHDVINTLGRLGLPESLPLLENAFAFFYEKDPLNMPALLREIGWLRQEPQWSFIEKTAAHSHFLFRWSVVARGGPPFFDLGTQAFTKQQHLSEKLVEDVSPYVRAEARFCLERLHHFAMGNAMTRASSRKRLTAIEREFKPKITFEELYHMFWLARPDGEYTVIDFADFAKSLGD